MLTRAFKYAVKRALGMQAPESIWRQYQTTRNSFLKEQLWSWLESNESQLPETVRAPFAREKWESDWFFDSWFWRAPAIDTLEARHRALRQLKAICDANPDIAALDELGCASGTFIRQATLVLPQLRKFRGWEISSRAVGALKGRFQDDARLEFYQTNTDTLVKNPGPSILATVGTLQYMSRPELAEFLCKMRSNTDIRFIVLAEITEYGTKKCPQSKYRRHQAYSHSYMQMLEDAGFTVFATEEFSLKPDVPWAIFSAR